MLENRSNNLGIVKAVLRTYDKSKDGLFPVYIIVWVNGKRVWLNTSVKVLQEFWNKDKVCVAGCPEAKDFNLIIENCRSKVNDILIRYRLMNRNITAAQLKTEYDNPGVYTDFISYAQKYIDNRKGIAAPATIKANDSTLKKIKDYKNSIQFIDIDETFINNYKKYLKSAKVKNNENTVGKSMTFIKAVLRMAQRDKLIEDTPFRYVKIKKHATDIKYLKKEELLKIWNAYIKRDLPTNLIILARYFLFSCFTGLRISDVKRIKYSDIVSDSIILRPQKSSNTTGEIVQIPLTNYAKFIIDEYKNIDSANKVIFKTFADQVSNRYLKEICKKLEINKEITYHSARHTFATLFLELNPGDVATLQKLLGHASIEHTMVYVHIDERIKRERIDKFNELFKLE